MIKLKLLTVLATLGFTATSQTCFNQGNGSGGAYNATTNTTIAGGSYSFTTFNINAGVTVSITGTAPLKVYTTGAVTINGTLTANGGNGSDGVTYTSAGIGGVGVAGGASGGNGSFSASNGPIIALAGSGPGGVNNNGDSWSGGGGAGYAAIGGSSGNSTGGFGGPAYGNINVTNLDPGSGGGGGSGGYNCGGGGGGAGGGVIVFNSGPSIFIGAAGAITANGGKGGSDGTGNCGGGGAGSGGTLWLAANTLTNNGIISAIGGTGGISALPGSPYFGNGANGANGRIRIDVNTPVNGSGSVLPSIGSTYGVPTAALTASISATNMCGSSNSGSAVVTASGGVSPYTYSWTPSGATTSVAANLSAGNYTNYVTDGAFCILSNTTSVNSTPSPTVTISGSNTVCAGSALNLVANGAATYSWSTGSVSPTLAATPTANVSYTVVGTNLVGCTDTTSISVSVAGPTLNVSSSSSLICTGQSVTLTASTSTDVTSYNWTPSGSTSSIVVSPTVTTGYTLMVTSGSNSCTASTSFTQAVSPCTGIGSIVNNLANAVVYPNPTSGLININSGENLSNVRVFNSLGKLVYQKENLSSAEAIDLSKETKGIYLIEVSNTSGKYLLKISVQ